MSNINSNFSVVYKKDNSPPVDRLYSTYREKWHSNPAEFVVEGFPLFLDIEATSVCNLKCPHCVQTTTSFAKGFMEFKTYVRIIDEASENGCYGCKYHSIGRGEPLLHRNISGMIAYAKKKGLIDVRLNTNGVLLFRSKIEELLDAGVDSISISIDGYDCISYANNRPDVDLDQLEKQLSLLKDLRDKGNYSTRIRIQCITFAFVDVDKYIDKWSVYADEIGFLTYKEMRRREYGLKGSWMCSQPWQRMSILHSGEILPCNHDDRCYASLGNINNTSVRKAWVGSEMKFFREAHMSGKAGLLSACDGCYLRSSELNKEK